MEPTRSRLPAFESLSPSGRYGELSRYCVDRLEQMLLLMLDSDDPAFQPTSLMARDLLDTLGRRRQTLHKGFLFQLQKHFTDFKSIRPARLHPRSGASSVHNSGVFASHGHRIQPRIEAIDEALMRLFEARLETLDQRMKYLLHRSDEGLQDNPLRPARLCAAFIAAIEPLGFNHERSLPLLEAFGELLEQQLGDLYRCCDLGLHELGIRDDLPYREEDRPVEPVVEDEEASSPADYEDAAAPAGMKEEPPEAIENPEATAPLPPDAPAAAEPEGETEPESAADRSLPEEPRNSDEAMAAHAGKLQTDRSEAPAADTSKAASAGPLTSDAVEEAVAEILADAQARRVSSPEDTGVVDAAVDAEAEGEDPESAQPDASDDAESGQLLSFASPGARLLENESVRMALEALKENTEVLAGDLSSFHACVQQLQVLAPNKIAEDLQKFRRFYAGLIENPHVSEPLRMQLLRLTTPLLHLLLHDPFFFRSSNHPVNDFLHSMIDFEIRHGHRPQNIKVLSLLVDNLLQQEQPVLSDFQPITQGYEVFKQLEVERLKEEKKTREAEQVRLRNRLQEWIRDLTAPLEVERDTLAFFHDDWQLHLLQLARQYGEHSPEVQDAFELARILAWSLDRNRSENAHYAAQRFTGLLRRIDKAMRGLDYSHEHRQRIRRLLIREFRRANRRPTLIQAAVPVQAEKPVVQPFFGMLGASPPRWMRAAASREPELYPDVASMIQIGDWIEVKPQPGSRSHNPQRGKLRWQSTDGIYRFFNQRGSIILETDAESLNRLFARGEACLLKPFSSTGLGGSLGHGFRIYR